MVSRNGVKENPDSPDVRDSEQRAPDYMRHPNQKFALLVGEMIYRLPDAFTVLWLANTLRDFRKWGGVGDGPDIVPIQTDWLTQEQLDKEATRLSGFA